MHKSILITIFFAVLPLFASAQEEYSGIYPHLAFFNNENECGTGAVVPWADRLWVITYAPHKPKGSSDKLYEITPELKQIIRPESVGGTPANRMIHRESKQLNIGPYLIDEQGNVKVVLPEHMPGRLTGTARHLKDPENKIYIATMEEGLYSVDVNTLEVTEHIRDINKRQEAVGNGIITSLPGTHGKGLYSGQGFLFYANNGERGRKARRDPTIQAGALASWQGSGDWKLIRRNQFTEITGPGGIYGNSDPETDPLWAMGWDYRSLILMLLDGGKWHSFRLPKGSHSYDGAHGFNTEWPRIRDIGEEDLLMTMHGMFWRFPRTFSAGNSSGIAPRSSYLKVVGDFCRWQDRIVLGCDDTAHSEFLNKRKAKGHIKAPQSQSNLWFLQPETLDRLGPVIGRGAVWLNDKVEEDQPSAPFLISGFQRRAVHLVTDEKTAITVEIDVEGNGEWEKLDELDVDGYLWHEFDQSLNATWVRLRSSESVNRAAAWFHFANEKIYRKKRAAKFTGLARKSSSSVVGGLVRAMGGNKRTLEFAAMDKDGKIGRYVLDASMNLQPQGGDDEWNRLQKDAAIPSRKGVLSADKASTIYTDDNGKRYRLPKNPDYIQSGTLGFGRLCREVATERDLLNCHGTFFELPAGNAGGFSLVRPVSTHNLRISDYCSYRGLLVLSGINTIEANGNRHIIRSDDGKAALWVGAIDDVWSLGKPVGVGGPWLKSEVKAGKYSTPYLMTGYDKKTLELSSSAATRITAEVDISGMGDWHAFRIFEIKAGETLEYEFPSAFQAYWIRFKTDAATIATAQLTYE